MQSQSDSAFVVLALFAVTGFMVWLVFFTGEGYKGIVQDIKSARGIKKERFPVPIFDRSKIDLPRPKKPKLQAITREPIDFNEQQLRDWASHLQQSIKDIRKEATELAKAYNSMPPSLVGDPSRPKRKSRPAAKKTTKNAAAKKTTKKPVKKAGSKRATAVKAKKKATPKRKGR